MFVKLTLQKADEKKPDHQMSGKPAQQIRKYGTEQASVVAILKSLTCEMLEESLPTLHPNHRKRLDKKTNLRGSLPSTQLPECHRWNNHLDRATLVQPVHSLFEK
jgi:hypothetical protein